MEEWPDEEQPTMTIHQQILCSAFKDHAKIGWDQFFCGQIANAWRKPIDTYDSKRNLKMPVKVEHSIIQIHMTTPDPQYMQ
jgi:hypothetical protein